MSSYSPEEKKAMWESQDLPTMKKRIAELEATVVQAYELGVEHGEEAETLRNIPCNNNILCTNEAILAALEKADE
ncbi:MAG: hypothetical protein DRR06_19465 [Gammaproteobacteria bacterium]|nr:MAG: hypothetical protein DRR06_19465 [Gammaproteobacteria bacterium]